MPERAAQAVRDLFTSWIEESMPSMTASTTEQDRELARELVAKARTDGLDLVGPDGVLTGCTQHVLERALEEELTERLV